MAEVDGVAAVKDLLAGHGGDGVAVVVVAGGVGVVTAAHVEPVGVAGAEKGRGKWKVSGK